MENENNPTTDEGGIDTPQIETDETTTPATGEGTTTEGCEPEE